MPKSCKIIFRIPVLFPLVVAGVAVAGELPLPAQCSLGEDCFLQNFVDMDAGPGVLDPYCGVATYDGHKGTDLRVASMVDMERGVPVIAVGDGTVVRFRDGEPDKLVTTEDERAAIMDRACGNAVFLRLTDGTMALYCHLKKGSVSVRVGQSVQSGEIIGAIGASGLAGFPHVHLQLQRDGKIVDPMTGHPLGGNCSADVPTSQTLFTEEVLNESMHAGVALLGFGLANPPFQFNSLLTIGPPPDPIGQEPVVVWGWLSNVRAGDQVNFRISTDDGVELVNHSVRRFARALSVTGAARRLPPFAPGRYRVTVSVVRDGTAIIEKSSDIDIE